MYKCIKRFCDIVFSALAIIILFIPMVIIAVAIKIEGYGSPFFKQIRVGKDKVPFELWKFRSMKPQTPSDVPTHLMTNVEDMLTPLGRHLRSTSLDELPQLFQIFTGKMSIVGPRPALPVQEDLIALRDENGANALTPGLTGWAQINGRDEISVEEKARLDGEYAAKQSFLFDCKCFFISIGKVLRREDVDLGAEKGNR